MANCNYSDIPDWGMLWVEQITSSTKSGRIGVLPISKSTWYQLVKKGLIPEGVKIIGKKVAWSVDTVKEIAQRMANGEFTNVDLWK